MKHTSTNTALLAFIMVLVAINLRPVIASVAPLVDSILVSTSLTSIDIGLLSTLPLLLMGLGALLTKPLRFYLGDKKAITLGTSAIAIACLFRLWGDYEEVMLLSAVLAGVGIAVVQSMFPGYIKRTFAESASAMIGLYSSAIVGGAAIAAITAVYLSDWLGWQAALALWSIPAVLGLLMWQLTPPKKQLTNTTTISNTVNYYKDLRSWSLLFFFGIGTGVFMLILAWLPAYFSELGINIKTSGLLLTSFICVELITALLLSANIKRVQDKRILLFASLAFTVAGLLYLVILPNILPLFASILLGIGIGIHFPLSLIVASEHFKEPHHAGDLTAL